MKIQSIINKETGLAAHITQTKTKTGYSVSYEDTDAGEILPMVSMVGSLEIAKAKAEGFTNGVMNLEETIKKRNDATEKIIKALSHMPIEQQLSVICSWISVDELKDIADFQTEGRD